MKKKLSFYYPTRDRKKNYLANTFSETNEDVKSISKLLFLHMKDKKRKKKFCFSLNNQEILNEDFQVYLKKRFLSIKKILQSLSKYQFIEEDKFQKLMQSLKKTLKNLKYLIQSHKNSQQKSNQERFGAFFAEGIHFLDPKYLCASKYFVRGGKVSERQLLQHHLIKLEKQDLFEKNLQKKNISKEENSRQQTPLQVFLCSGLNGAHTYITVGIDKNNIIEGEKFTFQEKKQIIDIIQEKKKKVFPEKTTKNIRISFVPVKNLNEKEGEQNFEKGIYVLLLQFNEQAKSIYYLEQKSNQFVKNNQIQLINGEILYKKLHKQIIKRKRKRIHRQCQQPLIGNELISDQNELNEIEKLDEFYTYNFISMLIIPVYKKSEYLQEFVKGLRESKKMGCKVYKQPFRQLKLDHSKIIWLLNHEDRHNVVDDYRTKFDKDRSIEVHHVFENVILDDEAISKYETFKKAFIETFQQSSLKLQNRKCKKTNKIIVFLRLSFWYQSIFGFLFFFNLHFRLKFISNQNILKYIT